MGIVVCKKCGGKTNTALAINYADVDLMDKTISRCAAKVDEHGWHIGCSWEDADEFLQTYIRKLIRGQEQEVTNVN